MNNFLLKLRQQPESVRRKILFYCLIVCAGILILIWIILLRFKIISGDNDNIKEDIKPFEELTDDLSNTFNKNN